MSGNKTLKLEPSTINDLLAIAPKSEAIRTGATKHPKNRAAVYKHFGYRGTMHYAKTDDMKREEDRLLSMKEWPNNNHTTSNVKSEEGFVYIIVGTVLGCTESTVGANDGAIPIEKVKQKILYEIGEIGGIESGTTVSCEQKAKRLWNDGRRGTLYYADTQNAEKAGNRFLNLGLGSNVESESSEPPGYVYVLADLSSLWRNKL